MFFKSTIATLFLLISASISHGEIFVCKTPEPFPLVSFKIYYNETDWIKGYESYLIVVDSNKKIESYENSTKVMVGSIEIDGKTKDLNITQIRDQGNKTHAHYFDRGATVSISIDWWKGNLKANRPVKFQHYDPWLTGLSFGICN